jgi:uncharacterized protein (DUF486 family)
MSPASIAPRLWPQLAPIILLVCSNVFMTLAWYGHLKFKSVPLVTVVLVSWGIAFVEYCFAVPANHIGSAVYSPAELDPRESCKARPRENRASGWAANRPEAFGRG